MGGHEEFLEFLIVNVIESLNCRHEFLIPFEIRFEFAIVTIVEKCEESKKAVGNVDVGSFMFSHRVIFKVNCSQRSLSFFWSSSDFG